jgi:hypothetical protein
MCRERWSEQRNALAAAKDGIVQGLARGNEERTPRGAERAGGGRAGQLSTFLTFLLTK